MFFLFFSRAVIVIGTTRITPLNICHSLTYSHISLAPIGMHRKLSPSRFRGEHSIAASNMSSYVQLGAEIDAVSDLLDSHHGSNSGLNALAASVTFKIKMFYFIRKKG